MIGVTDISVQDGIPKASPSIFATCSPHEINEITPLIRTYIFLPGEVVVRAGSPFPIVGTIQEGIALVRRKDGAGQPAILAFLLPTDLIGYPDETDSLFDIIAAGELRVSGMPLSDFMAIVRKMPHVAMAALGRALDRLDLVHDWIVKAHQLDAKARVTSLLVLMALREIQICKAKADAPVLLKLSVSREVIGNLLGLGLYTVSRIMGDLRSEGLISFETPHLVTVPDFLALLASLGLTPHTEAKDPSSKIVAPL